MSYTCSLCKLVVQGGVVALQEHTDRHIIDLVKHDHPEWAEKDGMCRKCYDYYQAEIAGSVFKDKACALRIRKSKTILGKIRHLFRR